MQCSYADARMSMGLFIVLCLSFEIKQITSLKQSDDQRNANTATPSSTCSSACTVMMPPTDSRYRCWENNLQYFTDQLLESIYNYTSIISHIEAYKSLHSTTTEQEMTKEYWSAINKTVKRNEGPYGNEDLVVIFEIILEKTRITANRTDFREFHHNCPLPLDYVNNLWYWLVAGFGVISVLIFVAMLLYAREMRAESKQLRLLYNKEAMY
ncbi:PREDICTED: uncharacterized protein LOC106807539 [Priapulus caudatus]|uniref:Uncharacterized protein LOC106807539 n=1 Tax=Priapulus caudatus TaxID=37621 RepID=A0ABM1DZM2_PRICU|nr:PREDICTED: uncharacterized protein LOC106807539 [Priapulus caudatus]